MTASSASPRRILVAAVVVQAAFSFAEQGIPTLTVFVKEDLGLSATAAGSIVSALGLGRAVAFYLAGRAVDRRGERRALFVGAIGVGICVAIAATLDYRGILVALLVAGFFLAVAAPAGGKLVFTAFPEERRGLAMGIRQAGVPIGGVVAAALLPVVAVAFGWRSSVVLAGAVSIAGACAAVALAGLGPRVEVQPRRGRHAIPPSVRREFALITVWGCALVGVQYALLTFLAVDVKARADVSAAAAATLILILQAGGIVGRIGWGALADRFPRLGLRGLPALLTALGAASTAAFALLPGGSLLAFALVGVVAGISLNGWQGLWMARLTEIAGAERAGTATGVALTFLAVAITVSAPLYGVVADAAGTLRATWVAASAMLAFGGVVLALLPRGGVSGESTALSRTATPE